MTGRIYVVTGSASGTGKATTELLRERGNTVFGVDLRDAEIIADLATAHGRADLVSETQRLTGGRIDAVIAIAGIGGPTPEVISVNFFGMVATLEGLRPLLTRSDAPRAVGVGAAAALYTVDDWLVAACLAGDESGARARATVLAQQREDPADVSGGLIYSSSKKAFLQWVRRNAATAAWAGASIPLNAISPGVTLSPRTAAAVEDAEFRAKLDQGAPMPLNGYTPPIVHARLLAWLASEENTHLCGQVIPNDGGIEVLRRGDSTW